MSCAYESDNDVIQKEQEKNKWCYDCKIWCVKLMTGDKVLLWLTGYKGKHKIQDQWENTVYEVVD